MRWATQLIAVCMALSSIDSAQAAATAYSHDEIESACEDAYTAGNEVFATSITEDQSASERRDLLSAESERTAEECRYAFAMGAFDAQYAFLQKIILEFGLELHAARSFDSSEALTVVLLDEFHARLQQAGMEDQVSDEYLLGAEFRSIVIPKFIAAMKKLALREGAAVPFGRFLFVQAPYIDLLTLYEYQRHPESFAMQKDAAGSPLVGSGSYQRATRALGERTIRLVNEYVNWQPSTYFGEDSWWHGSFWRYFNPEEPSVRQVKEEGFFKIMHMLVGEARQLNVKLAPYLKLQKLMLAKQKAYLKRDLNVYEKTQYALAAAPLIPVGMALGAAGLSYAGLSSLPAGASSFSLAGAGFWSAANTSALVSASVLGAFTGVGAYQGIKNEVAHSGPFRFAQFLDTVLGTTIQSFPLAAIAPALAGGGGAAAKYLVVTVPALISNSFHLVKTARALGFSGSVKAVPGLTANALRWWARTWWQHRRVLGFNFLGNVITGFGFEVYSREFVLGGEHQLFPRDAAGNIEFTNLAGYNRQALITMGTGVVGGILFQPALQMKTIMARTVYSQFLAIASVSLATLAFEGQVNGKRVTFNLMYANMYARWRWEALRPVYLSKFVTAHGGARQTAITVLLNVMLGLLESPVRNYLLDEYMHHGITPLAIFRATALEHLKIDISDFSDAEIEAGWQAFFADPKHQKIVDEVLAL